MQLLRALEDAARRSWLAGFLPLVRERLPWLHRTLLRLRDRAVPVAASGGLSRYQDRALRRFEALGSPLLPGDVLLEIGSDEAGAVLAGLAARSGVRVAGVNPLVNRTQLPPASSGRPAPPLAQADARHLPFADESVRRIFSVATLEHVLGLERALQECYRVLAPGGVLYADFGPIWSCSVGHHVYARVGGEEARHWKPGKNPVPNYAHLLLDREALRRRIDGTLSQPLLEAVLAWIYDGDGINRLFFEDYVRAFEHSPFEKVCFQPINEHVPSDALRALRRAHPEHREFGCRMIEVVLRKPGSAAAPPAAGAQGRLA